MKRISGIAEERFHRFFEDAKWEKFVLTALIILFVFVAGVQVGMWWKGRLIISDSQLWEETYRQKRKIERWFQPPPPEQPIPAKETWF